MTDRCEPPPELRDVDGWHWVSTAARGDIPMFWKGRDKVWDHGGACRFPECLAEEGWRYAGPITPHATVAALVEALEGMASAADHESWHLDTVLGKLLADARAALALYRAAEKE